MNYSKIEVAGDDAIRVLHERRDNYPKTGEYPFLIGDEEERLMLEGNAEYDEQDTAEIIRLSYELEPSVWMAVRRRELEEDGISPDEVAGEWPDANLEKGAIVSHLDLTTNRPKPKIWIGLAKIEEPWHLPAILKYGGWNDCPHPDAHCAIHRYWQERYGAEVVSMTGDVVECVVKRPPTTQEEAMELAWQQYFYCLDIVDQGCESVSNLAATLINSPYWYFWWD
jgi:hypothetical protein